MQSTSAERRHLQSDRHFRDRHGRRQGADPGPEPGVGRAVLAAAEVQIQGVTTKKQSTSILEFVGLVSPDSRFDSLFLSNYAVINVQDELARLNGVGDVIGARRRPIRHARLAGPGPHAGARTDAAGRHRRHPAAEPGSRRRPDRRAARAEGPGLPVHAEPQRAGSTTRPNSRTSSSRSSPANGGADHPGPRRRARRARRPDLQRVVQSRRQAGRRHRGLAPARGQRHRGRQRGQREDGGAHEELPAGARICRPLRHDEIRQGRDHRGLPHADRGGDAGARSSSSSFCRTGGRCWCPRRPCRSR